MTLEDSLKFPPQSDVLDGESPLSNPTRPTLSGLNWLAVPSDCVGLAYRVDGSNLQLLSVDSNGAKVTSSTSLETNVPAVHIAASHDGRLVAVCLADGSLRCYSATATSLQLRWTVEGAHSHVVNDINTETPSKSRENGAGAAGPVRSLAFCSSYALALVDDGQQGLTIYHADSLSVPVESVKNQLSDLSVACAAWQPPATGETRDSSIAVGTTDGAIHFFKYDNHASTLTNVAKISYPGDRDGGASCTHLDWVNDKTLAAGFCATTADEYGEDSEDDGDGAQDSADHEAEFFVLQVDSKRLSVKDSWSFGDVVPFFSVPKHGRHVFFTASVQTQESAKFLFVATNVGSDVAIISQEGSGPWEITDIPEGDNVMSPTDEDDEFMYPTGLGLVAFFGGEKTVPSLLLSTTDGSLRIFEIVHEGDKDFFRLPQASQTRLPMAQVEETERAISSEPNISKPPVEPATVTTDPKVPPAGGTFGSGSNAPTFGSGSFSFGSTALLGKPSTVVQSAATASKEKGESTTPGLTFGSGTSVPAFGASNLSPFSSFSASTQTSGSTESGSSPFNIFASKSSSSVTSIAKPLFGKPTGSEKASETTEKVLETKPDETLQEAVSSSPAKAATDNTQPSAATATAAKAFDDIDKQRSGVLPSVKMEELLDLLGEGFHGDELEAQLSLIDRDGSGQLKRQAFVEWYVALTEGGQGDSESDDDERKEEEEEARTTFLGISNGSTSILTSDFETLLESMGTTYCEESHGKVSKKLDKNGEIFVEDFVQWYVAWIFDDDDDSVDDEEEPESIRDGNDPPSSSVAAPAASMGWGDTFKKSDGAWKCEACMLENRSDLVQCAACETLRPGHAATTPSGPSAGASNTSAGPADISFGIQPGVTASPSSASATAVASQGGIKLGIAPSSSNNATPGISFGFTASPLDNSSSSPVSAHESKIQQSVAKTSVDDNEAPSSAATLTVGTPHIVASQLAHDSTAQSSTDGGSGGFKFGVPSSISSESSNARGSPSPFSKRDGPSFGAKPPESQGHKSGGAGAAKKGRDTTPTKTAYPPLDSKAPEPFSFSSRGGERQDASVGTSTKPAPSAYPPLDSTAPKPFDFSRSDHLKQREEPSTRTAVSKSTSGYPPLDSKAPKPFSYSTSATTAKKPDAPTGSAESSSAYPPLDSKAPKPFSYGTGTDTTTATRPDVPAVSTKSSSAYPPLDSKAPKPFSFSGNAMTKPTVPAGGAPSSSAYPPLDSKAPKAFSFSSNAATKPIASAAGAKSSSAYPPLDSKAPKPFSFGGGMASKEKEATTAATSVSSPGYPPLDSKAPKPFSFAGGMVPKEKEATTVATFKSASGYPPLDSKAPKPFSFRGGTPKEKEVGSATASSSVAGYPPLDSKAPKPFNFGGRPSEKEFAIASSAKSSPVHPPLDSRVPKPIGYGAIPKSTQSNKGTERQTDLVPRSRDSQVAPPPLRTPTAGSPAERVSECARQFASLTKQFNQSLRILSKCGSGENDGIAQSTVRRHIRDVREMLSTLADLDSTLQSCKSRSASLIRQKTTSSDEVNRSKHLLDHIASQGTSNNSQEPQALDAQSEECRRRLLALTHRVNRYMELVDDRAQVFGNIDTQRGDKVLLRSVAKTYKKVSIFNNESSKAASLVAGCVGTRGKGTGGPRFGSSPGPKRNLKNKRSSSWREVEHSFQRLQGPSVKTFDVDANALEGLLTPEPRTNTSRLTPPKHQETSLFTPPQKHSYRADWDKVSTVDQVKAKQTSFVPPRELQKTTFSQASREALAPLGTTPEKFRDAIRLSKEPTETPGNDVVAPPAFASRKQDGTEEKGSSGSASGPPTASKLSLATARNAKSTSLFQGKALGDTLSTTENRVAPGTIKPPGGGGADLTQKLSLSGMSVLGSSLDSTEAVAQKTETAPTSPDYGKILTRFYETHNPARVVEVAKTIEKYKGRESEMFEKLARKYNTANPLAPNETKGTDPSSGVSNLSALGGPSPFKSPPISSAAPVQAPSPLATTAATTSASPFSSSTKGSSPFGASPAVATTPTFGSASTATSAPPFRMSPGTTNNPSPFSSAPPAPTPPAFGTSQPSQVATPGPSGPTFSGRSPRDMLLAFYQQHNPSKASEVDKLLAKYQGKEEQLFRNLAKKYNMDAAIFGLSTTPNTFGTPPMPGSGGFGQASSLGGGPAMGGGFGQTSSLGGSSPFGASPPAQSTAFGSAAPTQSPGFGGASGSTFGSSAAPSFGSLAQSSGFGGTGSGGLGSPPTGAAPFGTATPFGAPRR